MSQLALEQLESLLWRGVDILYGSIDSETYQLIWNSDDDG